MDALTKDNLCHGSDYEAMKAKTLLRIKEFGFLSDTFTYEQKVASEIASTFPVGDRKMLKRAVNKRARREKVDVKECGE